jgi:hypothetical protein
MDDPEVPTVSIIRAMEVVRTSKTSASFYQTTRRSILEDLQIAVGILAVKQRNARQFSTMNTSSVETGNRPSRLQQGVTCVGSCIATAIL